MQGPDRYADRYVPADTNAGWPIAGGIILLAFICIATATYIHKKTYRHPTDVTWQAVGSGGEKTPGRAQ